MQVRSSRLLQFSLCLSLLLMSQSLWGQVEEDCRLNMEDLKPQIQRYNPFFGDHQWNSKSRIEMARIDPFRLLVITQDGCKRHHIRFTLLLDPSIVQKNTEFWVDEVSSMLHKVYFETPVYEQFDEDFEAEFRSKVASYGVNRRFNFPLATRNFICEVLYDNQKGARVTIEMITYLFKEEVLTHKKGIPADQDDGWVKNDKK